MAKYNPRIDRINEEYKRALTYIIDRELKNPKITGIISVTKVKTSSDLSYAKVYVSILNSKNLNNTLTELKKSAGFLRSALARRVNLRQTPQLVFELDDSLEYGERIDSILKRIMPKKDETKNKQ